MARTRPDVAAANAAQPRRNQGPPVRWVGKIDALAVQLGHWLGTDRARRLSDAELAQIAAAAQRLAGMAQGEIERRWDAADAAEDAAEERRILDELSK